MGVFFVAYAIGNRFEEFFIRKFLYRIRAQVSWLDLQADMSLPVSLYSMTLRALGFERRFPVLRSGPLQQKNKH